jgi:Zn-dependent peptidase ImmA (M78 family)
MMERSVIERKALELLDEVGISGFPIDLEKIASHLNIKIAYDVLDDDVSGFLMAEGTKKATAVINNAHHPNRQRFTIAHEIGHFMLHVNSPNEETIFVDKKYSFRRDGKSSLGIYEQERDANAFASSLLMPKRLVDNAIAEMNVDILDDYDMPTLAKKIGVSEQSLGFRLESLGYQVGQG